MTKGTENLDAGDRSRRNWADCRKYLRRYFVLFTLPGLGLIWAAGYAMGLLDGQALRTETISKESSNANTD